MQLENFQHWLHCTLSHPWINHWLTISGVACRLNSPSLLTALLLQSQLWLQCTREWPPLEYVPGKHLHDLTRGSHILVAYEFRATNINQSMHFLWYLAGMATFFLLNSCRIKQSRALERSNQAIKDDFRWSRFLIPVANTSTGDVYVTTPCLAEHELEMHEWHLQCLFCINYTKVRLCTSALP